MNASMEPRRSVIAISCTKVLVANSDLPSSSEDEDFYSDGKSESQDEIDYSNPETRQQLIQDRKALQKDHRVSQQKYLKQEIRGRCSTNPEFAKSIIRHYDKMASQQGWCRVLEHRATKANGYMQVS